MSQNLPRSAQRLAASKYGDTIFNTMLWVYFFTKREPKKKNLHKISKSFVIVERYSLMHVAVNNNNKIF